MSRGKGDHRVPGVLALTGGVATGKTTVAEWLRSRWGAELVDADGLAREAVAPGTAALAAIGDRYGAEVLLPSGQLDRAKLGAIVFANPAERLWLEAQIHPFVGERLGAAAAAWRTGRRDRLLVLVVPLLYETGMDALADMVWVVACAPAEQLRRSCDRDGLDPTIAQARIDSQWPMARKLARADRAIINDGSLEVLRDRVDAAVTEWLSPPSS